MAKKQGRGRPPKSETKKENIHVRCSPDEHAIYKAEAERLTQLTGQEWTMSGYLRVAGVQYAGKHLAGGAEPAASSERPDRSRRG